MKARKWKDLIIYRLVPLTAFVGFICFPFYWTLVTSLKVEGDIIKRPVRYLPDPATAIRIRHELCSCLEGCGLFPVFP